MNLTESFSMLPRRHILGLGLSGFLEVASIRAAPLTNVAPAASHFPFGLVLPRRPAPSLSLRTQAGVATDIGALLNARVTAVQLMFTGCSATCPIQGALFSQAQSDLGNSLPGARFLSISIDPLSDSQAALSAWLRRFDAKPGWVAAAPRIEDVDQLIAWLAEGGEQRPRGSDPHTGQVYIVNRRGELAYRTTSMPPPTDIVAALRSIAIRA